MRILITTLLFEKEISKYKLSFAACNFSSNLISGGEFDQVYSIMPLFVGGEMDNQAFLDPRYELVYDKLRTKGSLWQKVATFKEQWTIFKKVSKEDSVWFYNLNMINCFLFILLKIFKPSVKRNIIVLDFTPAKSWKELNYWFLKLINKADGTICLSYSELFTVKNSICLAGVAPAQNDTYPQVEEIKPEFLISGMLNENISMLYTLLIPAFKRMPNCVLHITGVTDEEKFLREVGDATNIHYHGQLSFQEYLETMHRIPFLLSTRNPLAPENECNFPSKIVESLLHNRIIISTIHYPQLDGINYWEVSTDVDAFVKNISSISQLPLSELSCYANQSEKVKELFSTQRWKEAMEKIESAE